MKYKIEKTKLPDVKLIITDFFEDFRGHYVETYNENEYTELGINVKFVRDDISTSTKGILRGIHYDSQTYKLIQCMYGKIYFVVVDMRKESNEYLKWEAFILSSSNRHQVLVPPGFGNGHLVLSDECIFHYKMSEYYDPESEKALKWDDPKVGIFWHNRNPVLSEKDSKTKYI